MKGVAAQFAITLALLMMMGGSRAMAQTPPNEADDFSAYFVGLDYLTLPHSTTQGAVSPVGLGFANFGFYFLGIPGTVPGDFFEDYTNKRERFDVGTTDPTNPKQLVTIWTFYDKELMYLYRPDTGQCTKSSLFSGATLQPLFVDLASSSLQGRTGFAENIWAAPQSYPNGLPGNFWTYQLSARNTVEFGTGMNSSLTPLYIALYTPGQITRLQFELFTAGQPDAIVFSLPAACAG